MNTISIFLITFLIISLILNLFLFKDKNNLKLLLSKSQIKSKEAEVDSIQNNNTFNKIVQNELNQLKINQLSEINALKEKHRSELKTEYDEGIKKGIELSKIEVRVTPIKRLKKEGNIGFRKEIMEVGYSYRLFSNNLPCLDPHDEIIEKVEIKELNEKFIELLNEKFSQILDKIPNPNFVITESIEAFTSKLISKKK